MNRIVDDLGMSGVSRQWRRRSSALLLSALALATVGASSHGVKAQVPEGYTTPIPEELFTPDQVNTSVGTFRFFDGMPDAATVDTSFDNLKFIRAYETFLTLMPAASIEMLRAGHAEMGVDAYNKVMLMAPLTSNPLFLTGNTDTVYGLSLIHI